MFCPNDLIVCEAPPPEDESDPMKAILNQKTGFVPLIVFHDTMTCKKGTRVFLMPEMRGSQSLNRIIVHDNKRLVVVNFKDVVFHENL